MQNPSTAQLNQTLLELFEAARLSDVDALRNRLDSAEASERYWAASWLGHFRDKQAVSTLKQLATEDVAIVRIASALAMCKLGYSDEFLPKLCQEIENDNLLVGMYVMNAVEQTGITDGRVLEVAEKAANSAYEFTMRYGKRLKSRIHNKKTGGV
jgi:hypothetical protein